MGKYCESVDRTKRRKTREVLCGTVGIGGANPIRIQSMTTSNTRDAAATIEQAVRLADAGCEIVRVTVQGIKEAESCELIKNGLLKRGYTVPLVADIHFFPPAAMKVVDFVEKVRVNPGNYADKRASFKTIDYDDASYAEEIEKIEEKFTPLVEKCKRLKRAMRIGTNHGSLSDRIMNRYGDTPRGMVESALEFARICRKNDYHDFVFSMKSSNPVVMVLAYRLLCAEMDALGWDYPLHLGVTEAGEGEDGRIKSAMGIGSLLLDGIGDTIRVSLTEDPWHEIDPCKRLIQLAEDYQKLNGPPFIEKGRDFEKIERRKVAYPKEAGLHRDGTVIIGASSSTIKTADFYRDIGCNMEFNRPKICVSSIDSLALKDFIDEQALKKVETLRQAGIGILAPYHLKGALEIVTAADLMLRSRVGRFSISFGKDKNPMGVIATEESKDWEALIQDKPAIIFLKPSADRLHASRRFFSFLNERGIDAPVILHFDYSGTKEDMVIQAAAECGSLLCDGLGDGLWLEGPFEANFLRNLSFSILQAARMRTFKTDFISCPSCGRTLFDLQDVTRTIKARTAHLPGVKIAIMGCIVNGPGEMADADFGYVGSKPGMIDLYIGKTCVEKDIPFNDATDRLVALIKTHNRWQDPED